MSKPRIRFRSTTGWTVGGVACGKDAIFIGSTNAVNQKNRDIIWFDKSSGHWMNSLKPCGGTGTAIAAAQDFVAMYRSYTHRTTGRYAVEFSTKHPLTPLVRNAMGCGPWYWDPNDFYFWRIGANSRRIVAYERRKSFISMDEPLLHLDCDSYSIVVNNTETPNAKFAPSQIGFFWLPNPADTLPMLDHVTNARTASIIKRYMKQCRMSMEDLMDAFRFEFERPVCGACGLMCLAFGCDADAGEVDFSVYLEQVGSHLRFCFS